MTEQSTSNSPDFLVYTITGSEDKPNWVKIGAAWNNRDGKGLNISMDALPLDGKLVLREFDSEQGSDE